MTDVWVDPTMDWEHETPYHEFKQRPGVPADYVIRDLCARCEYRQPHPAHGAVPADAIILAGDPDWIA